MSVSISRAVNRADADFPPMLIATCHADVVPFLQPDWVIHLDRTGKFLSLSASLSLAFLLDLGSESHWKIRMYTTVFMCMLVTNA